MPALSGATMEYKVIRDSTKWCSRVRNHRRENLATILLLTALLASAQASSPPVSRFQDTSASVLNQGQGDVRPLEPDRPIERGLAGGEAHTYEIVLGAGQFLHVIVNQRGIDVVAEVFSPGEKELVKVDSPNGTQGPEPVFLIAEETGTYRLRVSSPKKAAAAGRYDVRIEKQRVARPEDISRTKGERALAEAERLRIEGTASAKRKSIEYYEEAYLLMRAAACRERQATALNNVGWVYDSLGEKPKALSSYDRALSIIRELGDRVGEASALISIGLVYDSLGEKHKALDYYDQALPIAKSTGDLGIQAATLNNIGFIYDSWGENQRALDCYNQALHLMKQVGARVGEAAALSNIGALYKSLGKKREALDYYKEALSIVKAVGYRPGEATILNNIGLVYYVLGEKQKALDYYYQALPVAKLIGDPAREAATLTNIGAVYDSLGEKQKALDHFSQALPIAKAISDPVREATTLVNLGAVNDSMGQNQKALDYYNQALAITKAIGTEPLEANVLFNMARPERALGYLSQARTHSEASLDIIESLRVKAASPESRSAFFASVGEYYESYIDLLMHLHALNPGEGNDRAAFQAAERARARTLLERLVEAHADIRKGVDPSLLERERSLQQLLSGKVERRIRLLSGKHSHEQAAEVTMEVQTIHTQLQEVESQIRAKSPQYAALTQPAPLSLDQIQHQVLDPDTLLLEYFLGRDRSYLWAVTHTSITSYCLPKREEIEAAARLAYGLLIARNRKIKFEAADERRVRIARADARCVKALAALSQMVLGPVSNALTKRRLLILSDGALQYVPFAALHIPSKTAEWSAKKRPLILDHEIISLPSTSALAVLRQELSGRDPATKVLAVLADPVFEKDDPRVIASTNPTAPMANNASPNRRRAKPTATEADLVRSLMESAITDDVGRIKRLLFTRQEAKLIASRVIGTDKLEALDFDASRATAMSPEIGRYKYLHFATHAIINSEHPDLTGIILSLVDKKGVEQDGFLKAYEVYNMKLRADLVVLSGCRTALGQEVKGEGLVSLTRGFMYAGAARVLASLWNVSDEATANLMANFYHGLLSGERTSAAAAIRAAQIRMWKTKRWRAPYYWSGFVLQGEPR